MAVGIWKCLIAKTKVDGSLIVIVDGSLIVIVDGSLIVSSLYYIY